MEKALSTPPSEKVIFVWLDRQFPSSLRRVAARFRNHPTVFLEAIKSSVTAWALLLLEVIANPPGIPSAERRAPDAGLKKFPVKPLRRCDCSSRTLRAALQSASPETCP